MGSSQPSEVHPMTIHSRIRYCRVIENASPAKMSRYCRLRAGYELWKLVIGLHIDMCARPA